MHHPLSVCKLSRYIRILLIFCMASTAFSAEPNISSDWAQFQGPNRNGTSPENNLARAWPEKGPRELWSVPLGEGFGGPAVRDGEVYVVDRIGELQDILRCYSLESGKELWNFAYDAPGKVSHHGSRTTPTVTEKYVYLVGVMGNFYCIDRTTHKPVWNVNLVEKFSLRRVPNWGIVQAPLIYDDMVIVAPQSKEASIAAFNQDTGKLIWTSPSMAQYAYTTPIIRTIHGMDQAIMISAPGREKVGIVAGISLKNGKVLWTYKGWACKIPIPFPTVLPDNKIFITGGYGSGSVMIQITKSRKKFEAVELFRLPEVGSQIHQPLFHNGYLYLNNNENSRKDGMTCLSLDGEVKWRTKDSEGLPMFQLGNLVLVDNMIINMDGRTGKLHLISPSETGYKELASAQILTNSKKKYWAPMAVSQGKLVLRSQETLKCLDLREPEA